ncbi:PIN domain-containing protein [Gryllotalpicola protaetiae]|uniref:PIN domain-containing protein n=1 Tax=Gryllotalpicola protaetiae TaxID=2419771 RepID=UPI0013C5161E|nr:PIN domain-containing protein [Gryllotalpicola protaetiae]
MSILFLADNSVIQRLRKPTIRAAWAALRERGDIATCLPTLLEAGFSARSATDHSALTRLERGAKIVLPPAPEMVDIALEIQAALFAAGIGRAVGVSDLQIAATAIHHSSPDTPVVVVHYDADFDFVARVDSRFRAEWIVPRGTADG